MTTDGTERGNLRAPRILDFAQMSRIIAVGEAASLWPERDEDGRRYTCWRSG